MLLCFLLEPAFLSVCAFTESSLWGQQVSNKCLEKLASTELCRGSHLYRKVCSWVWAYTTSPHWWNNWSQLVCWRKHFPKSDLHNGWLHITSRPQGDVIHWLLMFFFQAWVWTIPYVFFSSMSVDIQFCEVVSHIYYCYVNCGHCIRCSWFSQDTHFD